MASKFSLPLHRSVLLLAFIEGYLSLSTEMLALRKFGPYFGVATPQTSIVVGIFLLFLSLGYGQTAQAEDRFKLSRNFFWLALILSLVFLDPVLELCFSTAWANFLPGLLRLGLFCLVSVAPLAFLFGRTLPLLVPNDVAWGPVLAVSTAGAFLGSVLTPLVWMRFFGVNATIALNLFLCLVVFWITSTRTTQRLATLILVGLGIILNLWPWRSALVHSNAYGDYEVDVRGNFKGLIINRSKYESVIYNENTSAWYNEELHRLILSQRRPLDVLVLGSGGFTLSLKNSHHRYNYVDIDPEIQKIVATHFNSRAAVENFVGQDAREFLRQTQASYDLIVFDLYRSNGEIPPHLTTLEALQMLKRRLTASGMVALNIGHRVRFDDPFSRKFRVTLEKVFGHCYSLPYHLGSGDGLSLYICFDQKRGQEKHLVDDQH